MITQYDYESQQWLAAGMGYTRPIVAEGKSSFEAAAAYQAQVEAQQREERRFAAEYARDEAMTARSLEAAEPYDQDGDLG